MGRLEHELRPHHSTRLFTKNEDVSSYVCNMIQNFLSELLLSLSRLTLKPMLKKEGKCINSTQLRRHFAESRLTRFELVRFDFTDYYCVK